MYNKSARTANMQTNAKDGQERCNETARRMQTICKKRKTNMHEHMDTPETCNTCARN